MGLPSALSHGALSPEVWAIIALVLVGADVALGLDFFVLSIGVAALLLAGLLFLQENVWPGGVALLETWRDVGLWFAGLSVGSTILIRLALRRRGARADVNEY